MDSVYIVITGKIRLILFFSFLILVSCETNPPNLTDPSENEFKIYITSNIQGAAILVNDNFTGKYTPDTLSLLPGNYTITLEKQGFISNSKYIELENQSIKNIYIELSSINLDKIVLLEDFANVSCDPCVISNSIIRRAESEKGIKIVVIKYSTNFPSPVDPFYLDAKPFNDARMSYYNILFAPTIIVDGINRPIPTDSSAIISAISQRLESNAIILFEVSDSIMNNNFLVNINSVLINSTIDISDYRMYSVVLEEEIKFTEPPGSNGETDFYNVMRSILPDQNGAILSDSNDANTFNFTTQILSSWNSSKLFAVVFVQNIATGEVMNAISTKN